MPITGTLCNLSLRWGSHRHGRRHRPVWRHQDRFFRKRWYYFNFKDEDMHMQKHRGLDGAERLSVSRSRDQSLESPASDSNIIEWQQQHLPHRLFEVKCINIRIALRTVPGCSWYNGWGRKEASLHAMQGSGVGAILTPQPMKQTVLPSTIQPREEAGG